MRVCVCVCVCVCVYGSRHGLPAHANGLQVYCSCVAAPLGVACPPVEYFLKAVLGSRRGLFRPTSDPVW